MDLDITKQQLIVNECEKQFELLLEDGKALMEYALKDSKINLLHTEVPVKYRGNNIASTLTKKVLDYAKRKNWNVMPFCPFVAKYIDNHPEYHDLLSEGYQM